MATKYPALPTTAEGPAGSIRIVLATELTNSRGEPADGHWQSSKRIIHIDKTLTIDQQWRTLLHEMTHVGLDDGGLSQTMSEKMQEAICVAISTARFRERFG